MNPWAALAAMVIWVASIGGSYWYGNSVGKDSEIAGQAKIKQAIEDTRKVVQQGVAREIAKIKIKHTTIQGKLETVVRDNPVYRDCRHDPGTLRLLNDALEGGIDIPGPDSDNLMPKIDATR